MSKKKNKEGLIIDKRYFSLIAGLFALMLMSVSVVGFVPGYEYRRPIQINTTENLTNYQLFFNLTNTSNMLLNRDDVLITYADDTNISFCFEDNTQSDYFTLWINYTGTIANETIYINYKNISSATSSSNIDDTLGVGLEHFYPIHGDMKDKTGSIDGTPINTPTLTTDQNGNTNYAYDFDAGDGFSLTNSNDWDIYEKDKSFVFRIKSDTTDATKYIFGNSMPGSPYTGYWFDQKHSGTGKPNFYQIPGSTINADDGITTAWTHFVVTKASDATISMYVNGVKQVETSNTVSNTDNSEIFVLGGVRIATINYAGKISEFRVYNVTLTEDFIGNMYITTEPTYTVGAEEINNPSPIIDITTPANTTYYTQTIPINITVSDESTSFSCVVLDNGTLLTTLTTNTTYTTNLTKTGGQHNISVLCNDSDAQTSNDTVYYYVWSGLNVSVYYSDTGNLSDNWDIYITNSTDNYFNLSNNGTVMFEWNTIPTGDINITVNETNATLYYQNATTNTTLNNSLFLPLNLTMTAKIDNPITLTSSLGLSLLEGQITTISCSSPEGSQTLTINDVYVSNPYILTVGSGIYDLFCQVPETNTYKPTNESEQISVNTLFSCTTTNTFAFEKNITTTGNVTTLNFTDAVSQNILKPDLSDVNVSGVVETWINTTDGYYLIVNNTGITDLNIRFGNYYANNSYSDYSRTTPIYDITGYTQTNAYQIYNLLDELTGEYIYPPNSTVMIITSCSQGETYINIADNDTKFLIATTQYINKSAVRVTYTADAYYSRQLYPAVSDALVLNFYLADAYTNAIDRIDFIIQDQDYYTSKLQVYKTLDSESIIITEGYFDASRQFSTYIKEDIDYYLRTNDDGSLTDFGRITVVAPDTKYLGLITLKTNPDVSLMANHITSSFYPNENYTLLYIYYNDDLSETINATITTFYENGTVFNNYFSSGIDTINIELNISDYPETSFYVTFEIWHETFGNSPLKWSQNTFFPTLIDLGISSFWYGLIGLTILMIVALLVSGESVIGGSVFFLIMILLLSGLSWINISFGVLALIIFLLLLGVMKEVNGGRS